MEESRVSDPAFPNSGEGGDVKPPPGQILTGKQEHCKAIALIDGFSLFGCLVY